MTERIITCHDFETHLGEFLEGGLDGATRRDCEQHQQSCTACAQLVRDLQHIAVSARSLPLPSPSTDLWPAIEARLETPVLSLPARPAAAASHDNLSWRRLAVAAVVLVTLSAGVTWNVARRAPAGANGTATTIATNDAPANALSRAPVEAPPALGADSQPAGVTITGTTAGPTPQVMGGALDRASSQRGVVASAPSTAGTNAVAVVNETRAFALDTLYGREIAMLRTVAEEQLGLLDSSTVTIVRRNLDIIDRAIMESRAALDTDPNSGFLLDQLDRAYERKVDLLRRLALL